MVLLDTKTGSIYELQGSGRTFHVENIFDGNEIYFTHLIALDSSDIEEPTLSQIEAIEELWSRYQANPVILNDEAVAEVEKIRKRWGLIKPKKP